MSTYLYKIVRKYADDSKSDEVIAEDITREEALAHTNDPETSSSTATTPDALQRTAQHGPWFDVFYEYEEE